MKPLILMMLILSTGLASASERADSWQLLQKRCLLASEMQSKLYDSPDTAAAAAECLRNLDAMGIPPDDLGADVFALYRVE